MKLNSGSTALVPNWDSPQYKEHIITGPTENGTLEHVAMFCPSAMFRHSSPPCFHLSIAFLHIVALPSLFSLVSKIDIMMCVVLLNKHS